MVGWIAWIGEDLENMVPDLKLDPFDRFTQGIQVEKCKQCGQEVHFVSEDIDFLISNDYDHAFIAGQLAAQAQRGYCPSHPKPNWMK